MDDYSTYQGAMNLFAKLNCIGQQENCIFGAQIDGTKSARFNASMIGFHVGGMVGEVVGSVVGQDYDLKTSKLNDYFWLLVNQTEYGIGILPLVGSSLTFNPQKLQPAYQDFCFYNFQEIKEIKVKNSISKKLQSITITFLNNRKLHLSALVEDKRIPYQGNCVARFLARYKK